MLTIWLSTSLFLTLKFFKKILLHGVKAFLRIVWFHFCDLVPENKTAKMWIVDIRTLHPRHSASEISVQNRSIPVPQWVSLFRYRTGYGFCILFHSGIGLTGCRTVWRKGVLCTCTSTLLVVKRHPARPYCWWWKDTLYFHTASGEKTPCTSTLLVAKRHHERPFCCWWNWKETCTFALLVMENTLQVHTVGGEQTP
jgi:hypothetical protein